jgi:hypothetical protein
VSAAAFTARYYLSVDTVWNLGDVLLTGGRSVPILAPGATSVGSKIVTVPTTAILGTYHVLACADDVKKVVESDELNNCVASAGTIVIGP